MSNRLFNSGILLAAITVLLTLAGCGSDDTSTGPTETRPDAPTGLVGVAQSSSAILLTWVDNADNETTFNVRRCDAGTWGLAASTPTDSCAYLDTGLSDTTMYLYCVTAANAQGSSASTDTISVTTMAVGGAPVEPFNPSPADDALNQELDVQLTWDCTDPDGDPLTYDVYFGSGSEPPLVSSDQYSNTYNPGTLAQNTRYRWKIVAKDNHSHETEGQRWEFFTANAIHFVGSHETLAYAVGVDVVGDYAFVADAWGGLFILDVSNPASPDSVSVFGNGANLVWNVRVAGDYAYLADFHGLSVVDISNPNTPFLAGDYDIHNDAYGLFISGGYVYLASKDSGLVIVNVADPTSPTLAGYYLSGYDANDVLVEGNYAYLADDYGLSIVDISDTSNLSLAGSCSLPDEGTGVAIVGNYAFMSDRSWGLKVIDITNVGSPTLLQNWETGWYDEDIVISGDFAISAGYDLTVIDISDVFNLSKIGTYDTEGNAHAMKVSGEYIYVANFDSGFLILQFVP